MPQPWDRRKPWPYDILLERDGQAPVGVMLRPGQNGQLVGQRSRRVDAVSPSTYDQGSLNPYVERPFVMGRLTGGYGEAVQRGATTTRYKAANGVDCSIGGLRRLAPAFEATTVPSLTGTPTDVRGFTTGTRVISGTPTDVVYVLRGRHVDYLFGGVFLLAKDFGVFNNPLAAVRFDGAAWVATMGEELWSDQGGIGWTQATLPVGARSEYVERVADELYIAGGNELRVCTAGADPLLAASWGGVIEIGDTTGTITGLKAVGGVLFIQKNDGWYSLNADGSVNELAPEVRAQAAIGGSAVLGSNGANPAVFRDRLWVGYAGAYYQIDADGGYAPVGPELLTENDSTVRGFPVSGAGHAGWFLYLGLYNPTTGESNLCKYGTWAPGEDTSAAAFAPVWHGSLKQWAGKQITRLDVVHLGDNPVLWVGFADGSVESAVLPADQPDPAQDANCRFVTSGYLDWADHHGDAQGDDKHWRRVAAAGPRLDATNYLRIAYRLDDAVGLTSPSNAVAASGDSFVPDDPLVGKVIRVRELLTGTATSTPVVESVVLYEQVRTARLELEYACVAVASNRAVRLDGAVDRRSADQIRDALRATAGPGPTTVWLPDRTRQDVDFVAYGEAIPNPDQRYGVEWDVPLALVQWRDTP